MKIPELIRNLYSYIYSSKHTEKANEWKKHLKEMMDNQLGKEFGTWSPQKISTDYTTATYDVAKFITGKGEYKVTFILTQGPHRLSIKSVKLLEGDVEIAKDAHQGFAAGNKNKNNICQFNIETLAFGTDYKVEIEFKSSGGNKSTGKIFIKKK